MYCTLEDIKESISEEILMQLTDDESSESIDSSIVSNAINFAQEVIDAHLRGRYNVPLANIPDLIRHLSVNIAVYYLYERRLSLEMPASITDRYKNSLKMLEMIQKGLLKIGGEDAVTGAGHGHYKTNKRDRLFSMETIDDF